MFSLLKKISVIMLCITAVSLVGCGKSNSKKKTTTASPTTVTPTTIKQTTVAPTTSKLTTVAPTTIKQTTVAPTTSKQTTSNTTKGVTTVQTTETPLENPVLKTTRVFVSSSVPLEEDGRISSTYNNYMAFSTIKAALDYYEAKILEGTISADEEKIIFLQYGFNGKYNEILNINIPNLTIIGSDSESIKIIGSNASGMQSPAGGNYGTDGSATVTIGSNAVNFKASNISFVNEFDYDNSLIGDRQALAILVKADQSLFYNCKFFGVQDTLEAKTGRQYYYNCYIEGSVDFIFGGDATAYFENCTIKSIDRSGDLSGYICAPKGTNDLAGDLKKNVDYGFIFDECSLVYDDSFEGLTKNTVYLSRPWRQDAYSAYVNCFMGDHIINEYKDWNATVLAANARFYEYENYGPGASETRLYGKYFTSQEAKNVTNKSIVFGTVNGDFTFETAWDADTDLSKLVNLNYDNMSNTYTSSVRVALDKAYLELPYDLSMVVDDIYLPTNGKNGSLIKWSSSDPEHLTSNGDVIRPELDEQDAVITLMATVSFKDVVDTKQFEITVPKKVKTIIITKYNETFDFGEGAYLEGNNKWTCSGAGKTASVALNAPYNNNPGDVSSVLKMVQATGGATTYQRIINVDGSMAVEFYAMQSQGGANASFGLADEYGIAGITVSFASVDAEGKRLVSVNGEVSTTKLLEGVWYKFRIAYDDATKEYSVGVYNYETNELNMIKSGLFTNESSLMVMQLLTEQGKIGSKDAFYLANMKTDKQADFEEEIGTNPNKTIGMGVIEGVDNRVIHNLGETYVDPSITVYNRFTLLPLTIGTDYTVEITGKENIDVNNVGKYTITITITLVDQTEQLVFTQIVDVQETTSIIYLTDFKQTVILGGKATFSVTASRNDGSIYYIVVEKTLATGNIPTVEQVIANVNYKRTVGFGNVALTANGIYDIGENGMDFEVTIPLSPTKEYILFMVAKNANGTSEMITSNTINDRVEITTADQFIEIMSDPGNSAAKIYIMNDIDFTNKLFVAGSLNGFTGILDGNGFTLSNFSINSTSQGKAGLIATLEGGTIQNIKFVDAIISSSNPQTGLIVGEFISGLIQNIYIDGITINNLGQYNAAVVGRVNGTATMKNISVVDAVLTYSSKYGGGIVSGVESGSLTIQNVKFVGSISCGEAVGAILGRAKSGTTISITNAYVDATITSAKKQCSSIIGFNEAASGSVTITGAVIKNIAVSEAASITSGNIDTFGNVVGSGAVPAANYSNVYVISSSRPLNSTGNLGLLLDATTTVFDNANAYIAAGFDLTNIWEFNLETKEIDLR